MDMVWRRWVGRILKSSSQSQFTVAKPMRVAKESHEFERAMWERIHKPKEIFLPRPEKSPPSGETLTFVESLCVFVLSSSPSILRHSSVIDDETYFLNVSEVKKHLYCKLQVDSHPKNMQIVTLPLATEVHACKTFVHTV